MPGDGETAVTVDPPKQEDAPSASATPKEKKEREPRLWEEWPGKDVRSRPIPPARRALFF